MSGPFFDVIGTRFLFLHFAGDGDSEHLGGDSFVAPTIELVNGLFEVGRAEPADIVIPVPSVSGRHAMLRVGALCAT